MRQLINERKIPRPTNYIAGDFVIDDFHGLAPYIDVTWESGEHPNEKEIAYLIQLEMEKGEDRESTYRSQVAEMERDSATVEDTEPEHNFGFMKDPHEKLYPCAWEGERMRPEASKKLKAHVLNEIELEFQQPDQFIYFTVYGSGASYNWDEEGDFDIQMWVDMTKFNELHEDQHDLSQDDLIAAIRRIVQQVNFPSFADLGLATDECEGKMLIQYYPKPGTGAKSENLAQKPYACYDMETDDWIVRPKPLTPEFYGEHFLMVIPKAEDIAIQAEAAIDELERNIVNWQFWYGMWSRYKNHKYKEQFETARDKAEQQRDAVKVLFKGVFGGRQEAYGEGGQGIEDERDITQKVLEVWGIFQKLKHYARITLPWEEQLLPVDVSEDVTDDATEQVSQDDTEKDFHELIISRWSKVVKGALRGLPPTAPGPHPELQELAQDYMENQGFGYNPPEDYVPVDPNRAAQIAQSYDQMEHSPNDPAVQASYQAMMNETKAQYDHLVKNGYRFEFYPPNVDPYPGGPHDAIKDLRENKHMYVFPTEAGFGSSDNQYGDHPLLQDSGERWNGKPVTYNDLFRAVHDAFGHGAEGVGFRHDGEDNAWRQHAAMFSQLALPAMTSETRGQNSWVNFGPHGEKNRSADQASTIYADQKAGLLPEWAWKSSSQRFAKWDDVMEHAQRARATGQIQIQNKMRDPDSGQLHVIGQVPSESNPGEFHETEFWQDDPDSEAITLWSCDCPWGQKSWGRTRQFKRYEGRPCAHLLALYWESLGQPFSDEAEQQPQQQTIPGLGEGPAQWIGPTTPGGPNMPTQNPLPVNPPAVEQTTPPQPAFSEPKQPNNTTQLEFPGTFSHWKKSDHNGFTNWETWNVYVWIANDQQALRRAESIVANGTAQDLEAWVIQSYIAPHNHDALLDAQEWNDVPEHDRIDYHLEDLKDKYRDNPDALNTFNNLFGPGNVDDVTANIIDPNLVNWYEIFEHIKNDVEEEQRYEQGLPPSWQEKVDPDAPGNMTLPQGWSRVAAFTNGDTVRNTVPVEGQDRDGNTYQIPRNSAGEVIWSDETDTIVIYPLVENGRLEPHLVRAQGPTEVFYASPSFNPGPRRRR